MRSTVLVLLCLLPAGIFAETTTGPEEEIVAEEDDGTLEIDTETTVDNTETSTGLNFDADFRTIYDFDAELFERRTFSDGVAGIRVRSLVDYGITEPLHVGARVAGTCFSDGNCDLDFVMKDAAPQNTGLKPGQFTFDELYVHWFRPNGSVALGRLQTRFVMRGGVYSKSLDRNNSNNVNINWTDGAQATYRAKNGWHSSFIWEYNSRDGASSIRNGQLDFDNSRAKNTWFAGFENRNRWGPIVQRALDISYLPSSLLKDGVKNGRRRDYWGIVGRLVGRWPQRRHGIRIRAGIEAGCAPETATPEAANLGSSVSGFAWNVVVSLMDFLPTHSIGINYAQTGAGWLLSPQYRPNEELFELRYIWSPERRYWPLLEARLRWRGDLKRPLVAQRKEREVDGYLRLTWDVLFRKRPGR